MKKIIVLLLVSALGNSLYGQNNVFSFFEFDIKDGMIKQFVNGYAKDIEWHREQGDEWSWLGWFVSNGPRTGRFIDASPNHTWKELGEWKIDGVENGKMNDIHWAQYFENPEGSYKIVLETSSKYDSHWYESPMLQVYHFTIHLSQKDNFQIFIETFKGTKKNISLVWMKTISGGNENSYYLIVPLKNMEEFGELEDLFRLADLDNDLRSKYAKSVKTHTSELWRLNTELSLIHTNEK